MGRPSGLEAGGMRRFLLAPVPLLLLSGLPAPLGVAATPAAPAPAPQSGWGWPLPAPHDVVRGFDPPPQRWLPGHRGVDLRGRSREPVLTTGAGTVAFAGRVARVPVVSIRHPDGLLTTYQPVVASVAPGDEVGAGERIGRLAGAGSHCAPDVCLHWGLRRDDDYLDPLLLVVATRVRLLPLADRVA
jgi:murein DD-endopeptidase MepM/ murein hydrolase activator NlpD